MSVTDHLEVPAKRGQQTAWGQSQQPSHRPAKQPSEGSSKLRAALVSLVAAALMTALKVAAGLLTGSLGMLSEAAHSTIDLLASGLTLYSVRLAEQPADEEHTYGHGKAESLSAFVETGLMLISALWISYEAVHRIFFRNHLSLELTVWPFAVLLLSVVVDFTRARRLRRAAKDFNSDALAADALHFSTDIWSSLAVLAGLSCTWVGERFQVPGLELADPLAALLVAGIILRVTMRLAMQNADTLLDATPATPATEEALALSPAQTRQRLLQDLAAIPDVVAVTRLRTRRSGSRYFADLTLALPRTLTFQRSEQVTATATQVIQRTLPEADVVVHPVPTATRAESIHDRIRDVAARANLSVHDVSVQQFGTELHLDQHLELPETLPLRRAHDLVTRLEHDIRREIPAVMSILTHIESALATIEQPAAPERDRLLDSQLRAISARFPEILDIHDVVATRHHDRLQVNCHCTLPDELSMGHVHQVITSLENAFRISHPDVDRLLIHPEPATDNRR